MGCWDPWCEMTGRTKLRNARRSVNAKGASRQR
jgi:hypothetical protein